MLSLIIWSEMCFKNLPLAHFFNCLLNFHLFFFAEDMTESLDEVCSSWDISSFEDSDDEPLSISESSDAESFSLSLFDSPTNGLCFLFLDPFFSFLGEPCLLFFWLSLFFASTYLWHLLFVLASSRVSDGTFLTWVISGSSPLITMQNKRNHLSD